jgi:hypothetical protein
MSQKFLFPSLEEPGLEAIRKPKPSYREWIDLSTVDRAYLRRFYGSDDVTEWVYPVDRLGRVTKGARISREEYEQHD